MANIFALTSPDELQSRADHGEAECQYRFAKKIFYQDGVNLDRSVAAKYFKMAADQNHPKGQNGYGACLEFGIGVAADMNEAVKYYALSAAQGDPVGQMNYGICLLQGLGVPKYSRPPEPLLFPITEDIPREKRDKLEKKNKEKMQAYRRALEGQRLDRNYNCKTTHPMPILPKDFPDFEDYEKQKIAEFKAQQENLNSREDDERFVYDDPRLEIPLPYDYISYSAYNGDVEAQSIYGRYLLRGEYSEKNLKKAEKYLLAAANAGDTDAKRCFQYYSTISERSRSAARKAAINKSLELNKLNKKGGRIRARSVLHSVSKYRR